MLDGGMGHQLKATGVKIEGPVGSMQRFLGVAMANRDQPELVRDAHLAYIDAGADVVTTNNYACVPRCLQHAAGGGISGDEDILRLVARAGELAKEACNLRPDRKVKVAGCLPPLAESYRADKVGKYEENLEQYRKIAEAIAPFSDVLLCETMSTADEAKAAFTAAAATGLPVWVAWTLDEDKPATLRSGESVAEAAAKLVEAAPAGKGGAGLEAVLFNCTSPEATSKAMPVLRAIFPDSVRIGGYANGFTTASSGSGEYRDLSEREYVDFAAEWISSGATIVGGCCGIFPRHIAAIHSHVAPSRAQL